MVADSENQERQRLLRNERREKAKSPLSLRHVPEEVRRAIRVRAAMHGRSGEAEIRGIPEKAAKTEGRIKLGSLLASSVREAGRRSPAVPASDAGHSLPGSFAPSRSGFPCGVLFLCSRAAPGVDTVGIGGG